MAVLSREQIVGLCASVGLNLAQIPVAGAICDAESGRNTQALGINPGGSHQRSSRDRGLWQINDVAHPDVSDACAFDPNCNARAMMAISSRGTNWYPWTTFNTGAYRQFLPAYQAIVGGGLHTPTPVYQPVQAILDDVRRGLPIWLVVVHNLELIFTAVRNSQYGEGASGTNLGGGFW